MNEDFRFKVMKMTNKVPIILTTNIVELSQKLIANEINRNDIYFDFAHEIHIQELHSSIDANIAQYYIELQDTIYRFYCYLKYNHTDIRTLSKSEKENLLLNVKISEGSSIASIDVNDAFLKFISNFMPQLNDTQFFIIILSIIFGYFGKSFFNMYLNSRLNEKTLNTNLEKEKQFLEEILKSKDKDFATLEKITSNSNDTLIKVLANFNNPKFNGEEIDALSIKNIKNKEKHIKREIIDGQFKIKSIDTKEDDIEILKLKILNNEDQDEESKYSLAIAYLDSLTNDKDAIGSLIGKAITNKTPLKLKVLYIYKNDIIDDVQIIQFCDLTN